MSLLWMVAGAAALANAVFWILVVTGLVSARRRGGFFPRRGLRRMAARAAQRFAKGEIDAETYRTMRDDLGFGARS